MQRLVLLLLVRAGGRASLPRLHKAVCIVFSTNILEINVENTLRSLIRDGYVRRTTRQMAVGYDAIGVKFKPKTAYRITKDGIRVLVFERKLLDRLWENVTIAEEEATQGDQVTTQTKEGTSG